MALFVPIFFTDFIIVSELMTSVGRLIGVE